MPVAKTMSSLAGLIGSDLEDDILHDSIEMHTDSNQESVEKTARSAASKGVAKPTVAKARKRKPASRRLSGVAGVSKAKTATTAKPRGRRALLKEQANRERDSDTEEVDEFQAAEAPVLKDKTNVPAQEKTVVEKPKRQPVKRGRKPITEKPQLEMAPVAAIKNTSKATTAMQVDGEFEYTPTTSKILKPKPKPKRGAERPTARNKETTTEPESLHEEIPETQADSMDMDPTASANQVAEEEDEFPTSVYKRVNHARSYSKTRQPSVARIRAGSNMSDSERASNVDLRRKLGETTKKLESLELKYRNLREVGIKEAETNFEKLKKASEHRAKSMYPSLTCRFPSCPPSIAVADLPSRRLANHLPSRLPLHPNHHGKRNPRPQIPNLHPNHPARNLRLADRPAQYPPQQPANREPDAFGKTHCQPRRCQRTSQQRR